MLSTLLSILGINALSSSALFGLGLIVLLMVAIGFSVHRWLLGYLFGGMMFWVMVELIQSMTSNWFVLSEWHSYLVAIGISWLPLGIWVLYRALRYEDVSSTLQQQREQAAARYIEHTPVYGDDYTPRFQ